ncbi:tetratricopeptide repeat protein [Nonomuraea sp. SMC257]|uniref:Tetratricopeptide repeat protein n=1 Tax=Nonomuraea montanisoli TaxID=2741721 RepID=A0A7Y6M205_9ACTN|nr:tetratricopeptide repeat protein [Nonomuraea montanisoli]NUW31667.1 tetratricopeptide repeat protein [Nonomuraea montanisoli]
MGPRAFRPEDRHVFFGRAREARELADHWQANSLTFLSGPAGAGKTSLLQAGVMPLLDPDVVDALAAGGVSAGARVPVVLRGGSNPYVFAVLSSWLPYEDPSRLSDVTIPGFLARRRVRRDQYGDPMPTLIAVDRAEDLLAPGRDPAAGEEFLAQLAAALEGDRDLRALVVVREDGLPTLRNRREKVFRQAAEYAVEALEPAAAEAAVRGPAQAAGRRFAKGAAERLVEDLLTVRRITPLGDEIEERLPLVEPLQLQVVCSALWSALPADAAVVTTDHVRELGDAGRCLADFYDTVIEEVARETYDGDTERLRARLREVFVDEKGGRKDVVAGPAESTGLPDAVVRALAGRHVLRLEERPQGGSRWRLSHDHLVRALTRGLESRAAAGPTDPAEYRRLAERALGDGDLERARAYARTALRHCGPDKRQRADVEQLLADIAYRDDDLDAAVDHYGRASVLLQSLPGAEGQVAGVLTAISQIKMAQGRFESALRDLGAAALRRPGDAGVQVELAWVMWCSGHANGAVDLLDAVLAEEGDERRALRARGEIMADLGRPARALRDLRRLDWGYSPSARSAYALALALDGRVDEALDLAPPIEHETSVIVLLRVARIRAAAGRRAEAADLAGRALAEGVRPPLPRPLVEVAERLFRG